MQCSFDAIFFNKKKDCLVSINTSAIFSPVEINCISHFHSINYTVDVFSFIAARPSENLSFIRDFKLHTKIVGVFLTVNFHFEKKKKIA